MEFNPTLGYIQGDGQFDIWCKFRPDKSILTTCSRYLVHQSEEEVDLQTQFTMRVPIKVVGAN